MIPRSISQPHRSPTLLHFTRPDTCTACVRVRDKYVYEHLRGYGVRVVFTRGVVSSCLVFCRLCIPGTRYVFKYAYASTLRGVCMHMDANILWMRLENSVFRYYCLRACAFRGSRSIYLPVLALTSASRSRTVFLFELPSSIQS